MKSAAAKASATWKNEKEARLELESLGLSVASRTFRDWRSQGAPIPKAGGGRINKAALLAWIATTKREKGRPAAGGSTSAATRERKLDAEIRLLDIKVANLKGSMIDADEARAVVLAIVGSIQRRFRHDLPARAIELARSKETEEAAEGIRELIDAILCDLADVAETFKPKNQEAAHA